MLSQALIAKLQRLKGQVGPSLENDVASTFDRSLLRQLDGKWPEPDDGKTGPIQCARCPASIEWTLISWPYQGWLNWMTNSLPRMMVLCPECSSKERAWRDETGWKLDVELPKKRSK